MTTRELEAVARAIYENDVRTQQPPINNYPWENQNETSRSVYRDMARAALSAIREPTERMRNAGAYASREQGSFEPSPAFRAMIDSILDQGEQG